MLSDLYQDVNSLVQNSNLLFEDFQVLSELTEV